MLENDFPLNRSECSNTDLKCCWFSSIDSFLCNFLLQSCLELLKRCSLAELEDEKQRVHIQKKMCVCADTSYDFVVLFATCSDSKSFSASFCLLALSLYAV